MTAVTHRISRGSDFSRTLKSGARVNSRDFAVHVAAVGTQWPDARGLRRDVAMVGGPWLGLVVSKSVGNAVTRHAVARRLRAAFAETRHLCPRDETYVVIRARASAADKSSDDLAGQLRSAFTSRRITDLSQRTPLSERGVDAPR
ncbi:ribonuclease P protein component [Gordonia sp. zg691]|uniref:Ribonuclease P protein component n=1 Tax=Gordonia jinghuaiqii TaxID=2758710 RepID=A0A7D7QXX4_9ACTN|nr:ribonuclease P protein component [Gordonia jinghuaiqii]MBD0862842.1 ribonuclease P protein component [Gordonia jinghuaiqii]MCR5979026.1 ribonuclease P protein component [Gordonia jinghuaiqii]QMT01648.1 ribonuclease P protein component [Gordonia jinghuaiqii]